MAKPTTFRATGASAFRKGSDRYIETRFSATETAYRRRTTPTVGFRSRPHAKKAGKPGGS